MTATELTCITCPIGCRLTVADRDGTLTVTGNRCPRGEAYARQELQDPRRTLTTTVTCVLPSGALVSLPVRTAAPIPKARLRAAMADCHQLVVHAPITLGQTLIEDLQGSGIALVASRSL